MSQRNDQPVGSGPGLRPPSSPGSGQPGSGVPGSGVPGSGVPGSGVPGSGVPGSGVPGSGVPGQPAGIRLPEENEELFHAILEISNNPEGDRVRLYAALLGATFLVPLGAEAPELDATAETGEFSIDVLTVTGPEGELAMPVFTHEDAVSAWAAGEGPVPPTMSLPGIGIFQLAASSPIQFILINPGGPFGGQVSRPEFEALAQELLPEVAAAQPLPMDAGRQNVFVDSLLEPLSDVTQDRLRDILDDNFAVRAAYLFLMQVGETDAPRLALGLDVAGAAGQWVVPQLTRFLGAEALSFDPYGPPELLLLENIPGSDSVRQAVQPFFQREGDEGTPWPATPTPVEQEVYESPESMPEAGLAGESDAGEFIAHDAAESGGTPDDAAVRRAQTGEMDGTAPRRRSLWPFRRQR